MAFLIISSSLNPRSRSRVLAKTALDLLKKEHQAADLIDLREINLPFCDGGPSFSESNVLFVKEKIQRASAILIAAPVYNYGLNAAVKNLIDLTGSAWEGKLVGMMVTGGGQRSYMAPMSFLNSLMLNSRCLIVPRFVYALEDDISEKGIVNTEITRRIHELVRETIELAQKLNS